MNIKLHKKATTTPRIRHQIQQAPAAISDSELARRYNVSGPTIARWRYRTTQHDRSHTRHNLLTTLSPAQEEIVVAMREYLRLSLDDLLTVARGFLHPDLSRSALVRLMKRRELPSLTRLRKQEQARRHPLASRLNAMSRGIFMLTSNIFRRCLTKAGNAISS